MTEVGKNGCWMVVRGGEINWMNGGCRGDGWVTVVSENECWWWWVWKVNWVNGDEI